ncbi:hypothetical protein GJ744_007046 [Endocarpon pusillum]|uniref:Uncharacterized protein n=1 Tax=Endocarpon pusillum TaxID=364733 RepID=A0A8H7E5K1_9EURO|nr:hypothetical protein GJ744_007046 [Endocarpon pusillum]
MGFGFGHLAVCPVPPVKQHTLSKLTKGWVASDFIQFLPDILREDSPPRSNQAEESKGRRMSQADLPPRPDAPRVAESGLVQLFATLDKLWARVQQI